MFLTSAKAPMENLGVEGLAWFGDFFALWWHNRIFVSSQKEEPDQSGIWFSVWFSAKTKQNKKPRRFMLCLLGPGERSISFL